MKKFLRFFAVALLALCFGMRARAQDNHVSYFGSLATMFSGLPSSNFNAASGVVYILAVQPNQSLSFYLTDQTGAAVSGSVQVFMTGSATVANYSSNTASWTASPTYTQANGYIASGAAITVSINTASTYQVIIPITNASQVAIKMYGWTNTATPLTLQAVLTTNGTIPINTVQGAIPQNGSVTGINPVLICGVLLSGSTCNEPAYDNTGASILHISSALTPTGTSASGIIAPGINGSGYIPGAAIFGYGGSVLTNPLAMMRYINVFHSGTATASGNTGVWTPASGYKFMMECVSLDVPENATQGTAGDFTIQLEDGATAIPGFIWSVYVPSTALTSGGELLHVPMACFPNGFMSSTANNVLNVNLSAALTTGNVTVRAYGQDTSQ